MSATATIPGRIQIQIPRLVRFRPAMLPYLLLLAALIAAAIAIAVLNRRSPAPAVLPLIIGIFVLKRLASMLALDRFRFSQGMLLPGVVLASPPARIAILADLGKGDGRRYDVLAIRNFSAAMFDHIKPGDRVPLCAVYGPGRAQRSPHWMTFLPEPVQSVTADESVARDALARIPDQEWRALDAALHASPGIEPGATRRVDVSQITGKPSGWPSASLGADLRDGQAVGA
jgi:hypothetical protein